MTVDEFWCNLDKIKSITIVEPYSYGHMPSETYDIKSFNSDEIVFNEEKMYVWFREDVDILLECVDECGKNIIRINYKKI